MLSRNDNGRRRVTRRHARPDGGVDDEDVVGAVDLGVGVDDGGTICLAAVVKTHFGTAHPVVRAAGADVSVCERDLFVVSLLVQEVKRERKIVQGGREGKRRTVFK